MDLIFILNYKQIWRRMTCRHLDASLSAFWNPLLSHRPGLSSCVLRRSHAASSSLCIPLIPHGVPHSSAEHQFSWSLRRRRSSQRGRWTPAWWPLRAWLPPFLVYQIGIYECLFLPSVLHSLWPSWCLSRQASPGQLVFESQSLPLICCWPILACWPRNHWLSWRYIRMISWETAPWIGLPEHLLCWQLVRIRHSPIAAEFSAHWRRAHSKIASQLNLSISTSAHHLEHQLHSRRRCKSSRWSCLPMVVQSRKSVHPQWL